MQNNKERQVVFKCKPVKNVCDYDSFKVYAVTIDKNQYPDIKLSKWGDVTIKGDIPTLVNDVEYEIKAVEQEDKYGIGYKVISVKRDMPKTIDGAIKFLEELTSENRAREIVREYPDIISRIEKNKLDDIDYSKMNGLSELSFTNIMNTAKQNLNLYNMVDEFNGILTLSMLRKIYNRYGDTGVLPILQKEPYKALTQISGVGFKTADATILKLQKENIIKFDHDIKTSVDRCSACIRYVLEQNETAECNTKMNVIDLRKKVIDMAPECVDKFAEAILDESIYFNKETLDVALIWTYRQEKYIAETVYNNIHIDDVWHCDVEKYRNVNGIELSDEQLNAAKNLCENKISILNGPAGAGKTCCTQAIIKMLDDMFKKYIIMAPTGKASKIISEVTRRRASTIHRGLQYGCVDEGTGSVWGKNENNKLTEDVVIVDEFSMVDVDLFFNLLKAIDFSKTRLMLIGDSAQLASVGCGNLLHDFMQSKVVPTTTLTKIFRYGEGGLMKVATDIRKGNNAYLKNCNKDKVTVFGDNKDYAFFDLNADKDTLKNKVLLTYKKLIDNGIDASDIQVLAAKNAFVDEMNQLLQKIANPNCRGNYCFEVPSTGNKFFEGDIVIQCANNYKAPVSTYDMTQNQVKYFSEHPKQWPTAFVANGESGVVKHISDNMVHIQFDNVMVQYNRPMLTSVKLGYAITIHKSQGSGINNVILVTPKSDMFILNSNLIYVGCTRTEKHCYHFSSIDAMKTAIRKKQNFTRKTFMQQMLKELSEGSY